MMTKRTALAKRAAIAVVALVVSLAAPASLWASSKDKGDDEKDRKVKIFERLELRFGVVASSYDGGGTVTVTPTGGVTSNGAVLRMGGYTHAAEFTVKGPKDGTAVITLPSTMTVSNGNSTTIVQNFTSQPSGTVVFDHDGKATLKIGATLIVPAGQPKGEYRGDFTVYADAP